MSKQFKVFHAINPRFGFTVSDNPAFNKKNYKEVATVDCENLDHVFQATNHIDHDWTTNPEVLSCNANVRSTSCGDVIVDPDGRKVMVLGCGFGEI